MKTPFPNEKLINNRPVVKLKADLLRPVATLFKAQEVNEEQYQRFILFRGQPIQNKLQALL